MYWMLLRIILLMTGKRFMCVCMCNIDQYIMELLIRINQYNKIYKINKIINPGNVVVGEIVIFSHKPLIAPLTNKFTCPWSRVR